MNMPSLSQRKTWIDFTRVLATFLVVMAHVVLYPQVMGAGPVWSSNALLHVDAHWGAIIFFHQRLSAFIESGRLGSFL